MIINTKTLDDFRRDFDEAVKLLKEKYQVQISMKSISYDNDNFSFRVEVRNGGSEDEVKKSYFNKFCRDYLMTPDDLDTLTFEHKGKNYVVSGLSTKNTKFKILAKDVTAGKEYGFVFEAIPELIRRREEIRN